MMKCSRLLLVILLAASAAGPARSEDGAAGPRSRPIAEVLRQPLPPEALTYAERGGRIVVAGPTFEYVVDPRTGMVAALRAERDGRDVVRLNEPTRLIVGPYDTSGPGGFGETTATSRDAGRIVLTTTGAMRSAQEGDDLPYSLTSTFYNDGVVVSEVTLRPNKDAAVAEIRHEARATGAFRHHLHKTRDSNGFDAPWAALPEAGRSATFSTLTSCLQVFSPKAGLAIFTDRGATRATGGLDTAAVRVEGREGDEATVTLAQYVVHERPSADGFRLKAGEPFTFRLGMSVVPNRLPHPRRPDLRMFAWIGDAKHPYPTDAEIHDVARLGFTLFQMHRLGTPGEPRPPAEELDRVIKTVHDAGMLFIWTVNADLMYAQAPGVKALRDRGEWPLWQGFNYNGRYTDAMDPYCDLLATCLASPNGLADYRIDCNERMLDRYDVDGMYIDDNLAYANCTLRREHGHPEEAYDSLIELHEMSWRRRRSLLARRPHAVLIDHCARATVLPVICDFDAHLYGEGYTFSSPGDYWAQYGSLRGMDAQGCLWPGDSEPDRNATEVAYNYDLLTGGGQYMYIDWRLYPGKFPYATGVHKEEVSFVRAYNLAQYGFGMYESRPYYFAESAELFGTDAPGSHATIYRNETWGDHLVVLANMNPEAGDAALAFRSPGGLGLRPGGIYAVLDVNEGKCRRVDGNELLGRGVVGGRVPGRGLKLFYLRRLPDSEDAPRHLWGGKRLSERWDAEAGALTLELQGPPGSEQALLIAAGRGPIGEVRVDGAPATFHLDAPQRVVHGKVRFGPAPVRVEILTPPAGRGELPAGPVPPADLPAR